MTTPIIDSELPLIAAPMAGGITTVSLVRAVAAAGAFPFLAGGYKPLEVLADEIDRVRDLDSFGVNLFVPSAKPVDSAAFASYAAELEPEAAPYGLELSRTPVASEDKWWEEKLALLTENPVPVVSFTFGLPDRQVIAALQRAGTRVLATVTNAAEAALAQDAGVNGIIVQGAAAGGHSAVFDSSRAPEPTPTVEAVRRVSATINLPIIAAGGVDGPEAVRELLGAGAQAVAAGTLLLRTHEAGTSPVHRDALADPAFTETVLTRAFTGRWARALRNGFTDRHTGIDAYPAVHHLTWGLRGAAAKAGDVDRVHLWAGTGYRAAVAEPAAETIRRLATGAAEK